MANEEHLSILRRGVKEWNGWRDTHPEIRPDLFDSFLPVDLKGINLTSSNLYFGKLAGVDLSDSDLSGSNLVRATLSSTNLRNAKLDNTIADGASFFGSDLHSASLRHSSLEGVSFEQANLTGAILSGSYLGEAFFACTTLDGVDFSETTMGITWHASKYAARGSRTIFVDCDLRNVKGLDSVSHHGRSEICSSTLSKARVPIPFLRGCGLSDWEIEAMKLYDENLSTDQASEILHNISEMRMNPLNQFNSCFISYSTRDAPFVENLHSKLQNAGVRCWFAPNDLKIGDRFRQRIENEIRLHDKLLLVLSANSILSPWVEEEVESAIEKEKRTKSQVLLPIRIDDAVNRSRKAWAASLRRMRQIGDFTNYVDESRFDASFERLLNGLRSNLVKRKIPKRDKN
jgi:hypothetical protein